MRVLVTGAAGFLGSAVCRVGVARGDKVTGLVRPGELSAPVSGVAYRELDWGTEAALIAGVIDEVNAEAVVHCAGATPRATEDVVALYDANVRLTWVLLAAVARSKARPRVVTVSSAAVYGPSPTVPITEDAPLVSATHYGRSKMLAEDVARAFMRTEHLEVCIARPFNMLGRGEPAGSVVSDIVTQLTTESTTRVVRVRETASVRDFIDVGDAAAGLLTLGVAGVPGEAYNICTGVGVSIAEIVDRIMRVWGSRARVEALESGGVPTISVGAPAKLRALGWEPEVPLRASLEWQGRTQ